MANNVLMMRYAASRGNRNEMNEEPNRKMMAGPAQPNHQVGTEQKMAEDREYRGNRNSRMTGDGFAENRYRGDDGRWKSGTRRSGYGYPPRGGKRSWEFTVEPQNYQVTEPGHEHLDPYAPEDPPHIVEDPDMRYSRMEDYDDPSGKVIGFGVPRGHYGKAKHSGQDLQHGMHMMAEAEFSQEDAEEWVDAMKNEDPQHPKGGKWDESFVKPLAQKVGFPSDGSEFWEFYAVVNSLYSDFCKVLKEYNADHPMCYAKLARAWIRDKDAVDNKTTVYYECIVKPKMEEEG